MPRHSMNPKAMKMRRLRATTKAIRHFEAQDSIESAIEMLRAARAEYNAGDIDVRVYLGYVNDAIECEERSRVYPRK